MTWKQTSFWTKVMMTIQAIGTFTQLSLIFGDAQHIYNVVVALVQLSSLILPIWMEDKNSDGIVDVFEKEVKTTITSDSPITIKTETENK
jgi:hypothetical protein